MDNLAEQFEEIEALNSIYDNWNVEDATDSYSIEVSSNVKLFLRLNPNYPSSAPPDYELLAPTLNAQQKQRVSDEFTTIYQNNLGGPVLYQWIEKLKEIVLEVEGSDANKEKLVDPDHDELTLAPKKEINFKVTHGDVIQDRKSVFQGHAAKVHSQEDVKVFMDYLLETKKIAQATHNIYAYRITTEKGTILQDCDDDGEAHAGGRVLHLLQILNITNVMVVVSRWYGGVHLGPDRFKHINNAARQVLVEAGLIQ